MKKRWYESAFENSARKYDSERFTHGTIGECDFVEKEIQFDKSLKILDVGCGTGRHAIELSKRGYRVTGIDLSVSQLDRAKEKAKENHLVIDFQCRDAQNLPFDCEFDVAVMFCCGAFPLMETDEMNYEILKSVTKSLNPNGKFIFTVYNGLYPMFHYLSEKLHLFINEDDKILCRGNFFDLMTFRDHFVAEIVDDLGNKKTLECNERFYIPSEITWLLKSLGYKTIDIFGVRLLTGGFSREHTLTTKDIEMLVIANNRNIGINQTET